MNETQVTPDSTRLGRWVKGRLVRDDPLSSRENRRLPTWGVTQGPRPLHPTSPPWTVPESGRT